VYVCLRTLNTCPHYCTDPDVTWGMILPLVVHYWTDLQSLHEFRYYDNIALKRNVSEYFFLYACLIFLPHAVNCASFFFWATVCKTVRPMLSDRCLSVCPVRSVTLVYCGQTVGRIQLNLRASRPRPCPHCVRWGPSSPSPKGHIPQFSAHDYCGQTVAHLSYG